jgi:glycosyltransferase involved in cell wall biosynthesis
LPLDIYRPVDRSLARQALDIEAAGPVMLVTAFDLSDRRKGAALILDALKQVTFRPFNLVTLGGNPPTLNIDGIRVHHLGYIDHERSKALAYSAADLYVHPALADNLPNTVMEAIACGTPVVGSNIGGVPDMIRPGRTGWLAKETSPEALAAVLQSALEEVSRGLDLRASCRAVAEAEYSLELQVERYLALFGSL